MSNFRSKMNKIGSSISRGFARVARATGDFVGEVLGPW